MTVSIEELRRIAALAKLRLDPARESALATELGSILEHMAALDAVDATTLEEVAGIGAQGAPLRADSGPPFPCESPVESFAPALRDGFFVVPRLDAHGSSSGQDAAP